MISIVMDSNERGTDRADALQKYLMRHPKEYDFAFGEVEVDLVFHLMSNEANPNVKPYIRKSRAVELKMPADFVQSLQNGHLSEQRRQCPCPLQIAVLGSLGDVLRALPEVTGKGWRNPGEMARAKALILHDISHLKASGVDVSFGLSRFDYYIGAFDRRMREPDYRATDEANALTENMAQVVREARAYLEGDIHLPRPKAESWQEYALCGLPGVGPERARAMSDAGCAVRLFYGANAAIPSELVTIPGIGKKTAQKILEAVR